MPNPDTNMQPTDNAIDSSIIDLTASNGKLINPYLLSELDNTPHNQGPLDHSL